MYPQSLIQVKQFHLAFGHPVADKPNISDAKLNKLRVALISEELEELKQALADGDVVATLDALTDLQFVLDGAYLAFGLHPLKTAASSEVYRSNMSKLGEDGKPVVREDGKILKGPSYSPPKLKAIYERYAKKLGW